VNENGLLVVRDVSRSFGDFKAVKELNFSLSSGEVVGLLGPNGAGKTTSVRMIMGMLKTTSGSISVSGLDCFEDRPKVQEVVGYLPDEPYFQPYLRGYEILEFIAKVRNLPYERVQEHIDDLGTRLELVEDLGDFAANYSQGMRKKMAYLMATIHSPKLLIMDEPTNGLDPRANRAFLEDLTARAEAGASVLYSTHLLDQAEKVCDRCIVMHHGEKGVEGRVDELKAQVGTDSSLEDVFFCMTQGDKEFNLK